MNLDFLISKYLDGELTQEEDFALREIVKADPYSRSIFDDYIDIQLEIQKDAQSIKLPNKLKKSTEDIVMMEIMKATPVVIHKIQPVVARRRFPQFLSMVAVLLLFFVFSIYEYKSPIGEKANILSDLSNKSDMPIFEGKYNETKVENKNVKSVVSNLKSSKTTNQLVKSESNANNMFGSVKSNISSEVLANNIDENSKSTSEFNFAEFNNNNIDKSQKNNVVNNDAIKIKSQSNPTSNFSSRISNMSGAYESSLTEQFGYDMFYERSDIIMSSSYIQGFFQDGLATSPNTSIKHYSQSLAFVVSESAKIGIEFGLTEFQFDKRSYIRVPLNSVNSNNSTGNKVEVPDPYGDNNSILVAVNINQSQQLYWGTMFYEQNLISYDRFILDSKLGIGASNSGFVSFGRLSAKYDIYRGIFLAFGTEARLFSTDIIKSPNDNISKSLGFVYGIQFKF